MDNDKLYYSAIEETRTKEGWDKESLRVYNNLGIPRPEDWWKRWKNIMGISTVHPKDRITKTIYKTDVGEHYRGRGLSQIRNNSKSRKKVVTDIQGFVPDSRTLKQLKAITSKDNSDWKYTGEIVLRDDLIIEPKPTLKIKPKKQKLVLTELQIEELKEILKDNASANGKNACKSKVITTQQRDEIIQLLGEGKSYRSIASEYGVSRGCVQGISDKLKQPVNDKVYYTERMLADKFNVNKTTIHRIIVRIREGEL